MHDDRSTWRRREFLACGSAGLAASFLVAPHGTRAAEPLAAEPRFALAYVAGSDLPRDETDAPLRLVRAAALPAGDAAFARHGAQLAIEGRLPVGHRPGRGLESLAIDLDHRPFSDIVLHLWRIDARPVLNLSRPVGLTVPVDAETGLVLSVALGARGATSRTALRFGTGQEPGLPKLRRGTYVMSWPEDLDGPEPALGACRWNAPSIDGLARYDRRQEAWVPVDFPYVTLSLEPAPVPEALV